MHYILIRNIFRVKYVFNLIASAYLNCAGEYAVVFGKTRRNVRPDEAWNDIEGFCPALDMGLQNYRDTDQGSMPRTCCMGRVVQVAHIGDETNWGPHT